VNNDAFFYVTDQEQIDQAIPGILDKHDKLGGFKLEYSLLLTEEIVRNCEKLSDSKVLNYLAKCVKAAE
jgi:hypothetical protein